jgi:hypothetical protein
MGRFVVREEGKITGDARRFPSYSVIMFPNKIAAD